MVVRLDTNLKTICERCYQWYISSVVFDKNMIFVADGNFSSVLSAGCLKLFENHKLIEGGLGYDCILWPTPYIIDPKGATSDIPKRSSQVTGCLGFQLES